MGGWIVDSFSGFTSTSLGYLIAYLLPGLTGLFAATYYFHQLHNLLWTATSGNSNFGLVLVVLLVALTIGLLLIPFREIIYSTILLGRGADYPENATYTRLTDVEVLPAYRMLIDDNYRYFQFWAAMSLCIPFLAVGLCRDKWSTLSGGQQAGAIGVSILIEVACIWTARRERKDFCEALEAVLA
jgi:hypothetical protein